MIPLRVSAICLALLAVATAAGCKKEAPPEPAEARRVEAALTRIDSAAAAFAKGLTEEKVKGLLTYEQEMLPHAKLLRGVGAAAAGGEEPSRDARLAEITRVTEAALAKAGITQADVAHFTTLTAELFASEIAVEDARRSLAENPPKVERWKAIEAEAETLEGAARFAFLQEHMKNQPLPDYMVKALQEQVDRHEQVRKDFAAKHGAQTLALLDGYQPEFVAIRKKQLNVALGKE